VRLSYYSVPDFAHGVMDFFLDWLEVVVLVFAGGGVNISNYAFDL
jgi:hypothetical protein